MATDILTSATPEELAEQFPGTNRPFAVWYNDDPGCNERKWAVNDESGMAIQEFEDMGMALKAAAALISEWGWEEDARKQADALAKVVESKNADNAELLDIQERLDLMMSGKDDGAKSRIVKMGYSAKCGESYCHQNK